MTRVQQTILASDELNAQGVYGNCLQAAIASVLDKPLDAVPNFAAFHAWLLALKLWTQGEGLKLYAESVNDYPDRLAVVMGPSPREGTHAVVGSGGQMVWDPHPSGDGLASVQTAFWFETEADLSGPQERPKP